MKVADLLRKLDLGNSVAEYDSALVRYFLRTDPFDRLVSDRADILAGDKGTGKSAVFRILANHKASVPELNQIDVLPAFNPAGEPIFQRLTREKILDEASYIPVWKAYFFGLVGNWIIDSASGLESNAKDRIDEILRDSQLKTNTGASSVFDRIIAFLRTKVKNLRSAQGSMSFTPEGIPVFAAKIDFGDKTEPVVVEYISFEQAFELVDQALSDLGARVWVVLDRLDEAFQGRRDVETPALRALLRAFLDLHSLTNLKLKLFLRNDLFRLITKNGFVNLSHVNARKAEIIWQPDDLLNLLCERIRQNGEFMRLAQLEDLDNREIFARIFPEKVDNRGGQSYTFEWVMERIRDAQWVRPPRNLIDIVGMAIEEQLRKEEREARDFAPSLPMIEPESLREALTRLSERRVQDTLISETGDVATLVEKFRDRKTEHNEDSLRELLGVSQGDLSEAIQSLIEIGFLQKFPSSYKVPFLYRYGLNMREGKAYQTT